jgi:predicted MFS family arabinose efflux permease
MSLQICKKKSMKNRSLYVLASGIFGIATTEFGVVAMLPQLAKVFNVTIDKAGWLISAFALIVACSGPFIVSLTARINRKKLMCISLLVFCLANIYSALATSFTALLISRMLPAFFHPVFWSIALSAAINMAEPAYKSKAVSIVFSGFTLACVLGTPLLNFITNMYSWQAAFYFSALINALSFIGLIISLPEFTPAINTQTVSKTAILKQPVLWVNIAVSFCIISAMYCSYSYIVDYLEQVFHVAANKVSVMLILFGITGIIGNNLAGRYMGVNTRATLFSFIVALTMIHILLFFGAAVPPLPAVAIMVALWGLIHTAGFVISNINVTATAPAQAEFLNSIFTSVGNFAVTAGAATGGFWIAHFGVHNIIWVSILFLIVAISVALLSAKEVTISKTTRIKR